MVSPLVLLLVAGLPALSAEAALRPLCGRGHAYAVELLSQESLVVRSGPRNGYYFPSDVTEEEAAALLARGDFVKSKVPSLYSNDEKLFPIMQMGVPNAGGRWGTGLCWWHTRFHRAAVYLMDFAPKRPKPTAKEARVLLARISEFKPATVPGYGSLAEFTQDFKKELYSVLSDWELRTTVLAPENALGGFLTKLLTSAGEKRRLFNQTARNIVDDVTGYPRPVFLMMEIPGGIHAILALGARWEDDSRKKILLRQVDSTEPGTSSERYFIENGEFSPTPLYREYGFHAAFGSDFNHIQNGLRTRCGANYQIPRK